MEGGAFGEEDAFAGDTVENVADGDGAGFAVGFAEGEEEGGFDEFVGGGKEGAVVEGGDDGEKGVGAAVAADADDFGGAGGTDAGGTVMEGVDDAVEDAAGVTKGATPGASRRACSEGGATCGWSAARARRLAGVSGRMGLVWRKR